MLTMKFLRIVFHLTIVLSLSVGCEKHIGSSLPVDGDGNTYDTVVLGTQVWLTENLKTTKYNDGYPIPLAEENDSWTSTGRAAYCWYQNNPAYKDFFGAIYNYYAAQLHEYICPVGYHVPTEEEWETLFDYFNNSSSDVEESFKAKRVGWRAWDGYFSGYFIGGWWIYALDGAVMGMDNNIDYLPKNTGFSIRCVKNK